jgi:PAS domain S-box-containing protein
MPEEEVKTKMEQFPANNPNPVLRAGKDGTVLYSNVAGEPLLHGWGVNIGEKLPSYVTDVVQRVIFQNSPEKMEVKAGNHVYLVSFHPLPEEEYVNIYGFDISEQKDLEDRLRESEEKYRAFFENSIDAVLLTSTDGTISTANPEACRIFGMTEEEINQAGRNGVVDTSDPGLKLALEERVKTGKFRGELNLRRKDGTIFPGDVSTVLFTDRNGYVKTSMHIRDITERKQMEEALRESEIKYRNIVETANEGIWVYDADIKFTYVNKKMADMLGYGQEEIICMSACDFMDEEGKVIAQQNLEKRRQGISDVHEFKLICKDSSPIWMSVSSKALFDDDGKFAGTLSMYTDITERKQMDKVLQQSEEKYRSLFENLNSAALLIEPIFNGDGRLVDLRYLMANPSVKKHIGKTPDELVGKLYSEVFHYPRRNPVFDIYDDVLSSGKSFNSEIFLPALNKHYDMSIYRPIAGQLALVISDISDRKKAEELLRESEQRLQAILDGSDNAFYVKDLKGRFILINKRLEELLGMKRDEVYGKTDYDFFTPELADSYKVNDSRILKSGVPEQLEEVSDLVDGRHIFLANKFPLYDLHGKPYAICGISTDITERKQIEESLREAYENLQVQSEELQVQSEELQMQNEELQSQSNELNEAYGALHELEKHYRMLFTNMTEAFYLIDVIYDKNGKPYDYRFLEVNPAYEHNMGVKKGQMLGKSLFEVFPNASPITIEKYNEIAISGQSNILRFLVRLLTTNTSMFMLSALRKGSLR